MITSEKIQEIADNVAREFQPEKIILFGSFAWGTPTEDSDVDLFIVKEGEGKRWEKERAVYKFLAGAKIPIDVLVYTGEEAKQSRKKGNFFLEDIFTKGRTLYSVT
jgi:predicted nucleotidyltransferase